ncbi:hypothetical protein INT45_012535 [Circinella minor]|uniref:Arginine N-methyltransferase 2 n=1 Tax=Circinella minor TaxID=1195481 RepID=A0A8H7S399_9FUNG|nr:hypothetical protein INT45_012535 [Circinella minor]
MAEEQRSPKRQKSEEPVESEIEYSEEELKKGTEFINAIIAGDLEKAKTLEKEGADICFNGNERGRTPLHYAAEKGHKDIVQWLLRESQPYNLLDKDQVTAGELALKNNHLDIYNFLVEEGTRAELLLRAIKSTFENDEDDQEEEEEGSENNKKKKEAPNEDYLNQKLHYDDNKLLDENNDAVMMGWEGPLMIEHAKVMCPREGMDVLNVGFGLGLIDMELQKYKPRNHFIIEAHPDVYAYMKQQGWDKKEGVTILFGRWQDVVPTLEQAFDGIFFDTYGEFYDDLRAFHDAVPNILNEGGIYTWFNGLGATNQFFHDIYCRVSELDLHDFGLSTEYVDIPIGTADEKGVWDGVRQRYWVLDTYKLPICKFLD